MKIKFTPILLLSIVLYSCQPVAYLPIETIKPAKININPEVESFALLYLDNDLNNDQIADTVLSRIVVNELILGFYDIVNFSARVDSTTFKPITFLYNRNEIYFGDILNWMNMRRIGDRLGVDALILLDSLTVLYEQKEEKNFPYGITEYHLTREFNVVANWQLLDLVNRKVVDKYTYREKFLWEDYGEDISYLKREFPKLSTNIKETGYWTGYDYAQRIFPLWREGRRMIYVNGNKDFSKAYEHVMQNNWDDAVPLWEKNIKNSETELSSRALYNLAVAAELMGNIPVAMEYANRSYRVKRKKATLSYLSTLNRRKRENNKLKGQF